MVSKRLLSLNPTTILIILLLGLWLLLDCDNFRLNLAKLEVWIREHSADYFHFARISEKHFLLTKCVYIHSVNGGTDEQMENIDYTIVIHSSNQDSAIKNTQT